MTYASHLPGFYLDFAEEEAFGPGVLRHLSFDEWREYDDEFPFQSRNYDRSHPLFLLADGDGTEDDLRQFVQGPASLVLYALNLRNPDCPPRTSPMLSMSYLRSGPSWVRVVGPLDREAIVWGIPSQPSEPITAAQVPAARLVHRLLVRTEGPGPVAVLLHALETSGRPDVDPVTGFCLCVAALEAALLPDQLDEIRTTFARRVAAVGTDGRDEFDRLRDHAYDLHGLRSEIVHGRVRAQTLAKLELPSLDHLLCEWARNVVRPVLIRLAALEVAGVTADELPALLDAATDSVAEQEVLSARVREGMRIDG